MDNETIGSTAAGHDASRDFALLTIRHPNMEKPLEDLLDTVRDHGGYDIVVLYGPTGVGKTTIISQAVKKITAQAQQAADLPPGSIPVAVTEAIAPENGKFGWKDYYIRALTALSEPLIDRKIDYEAFERTGKPPRLGSVTTDTNALRRALEHALRHRQPAAFFVDEAQHFASVAGGRKLKDQLEVIKSLANTSRSLHVLVGTYELLMLQNLSGQLSRRVRQIHMPRYRAEVEQDRLAFARILLAFQTRLPVPEPPNLLDSWEYLYTRSVGCVGILKNWLLRSLNAALEDGSPTILPEHLRRHALSTAQCERIAKEALEGERRVADSEADDQELRSMLGFESPAGSTTQETDVKSRERVQRRVGQRKPQRDPVGSDEQQAASGAES